MDKQKQYKILNTIKSLRESKPIISFLISFIIIFSIMHIVLSLFSKPISVMHYSFAESKVDEYVNNLMNSGKQASFDYNPDTEILSLVTNFYTKLDENGNVIQKSITVNMYQESYIPFVFLFSLLIIDYKNLKSFSLSTIAGMTILNFYIIIKIACIFFDNHSYPEFAIYGFDSIIGVIVFYFNKLLKSTGNSLNYIVVAVIWVAVSKTAKELLISKIKI